MPASSDPSRFLTSQPPELEKRSWLPWLIAGVVVLVLLGGFLFSSYRQRAAEQAASASQTPDAYASRIGIADLQMSEAANYAGSKVTYVDGTVTNQGDRTVTGIGVAVTFLNDIGQPPQKATMPLTLIRTREPYVDIEPVSAEPLQPGASHAFRLIFDHVSPSWNQHYPTVEPISVKTK